ncbi:MAG: uncharacterized protein QG620_266 [Patescibacteria group bacterium]|nr:uncharacterized protein [Patescibacteria group bacterium]
MKKYNPAVHFEMPYADGERLSNFYRQAFGWEMKKLGEDMGHYILAGTTETDEKQMVKKPGTINGGFFPENSSPEAKYPSIVIAVEDINEAMEKVKEAGGKVLGDPMEIPNVGRYVSFIDTEGNRVSLLETGKMYA